ncbi:MAG TPA: zf-HC2 domain-containing protein, partial [Caulobacteraceae bacterium]|nr:zf-HC2 domain-containing protein [Caulobacteraceae bacterium]
MGRILDFSRDRHAETRMLLPWYDSGALEPDELQAVEAHLAACAECRAELAAERRLEAEVADLPLDVDAGWAAMRALIEAAPPRHAPFASAGRRAKA